MSLDMRFVPATRRRVPYWVVVAVTLGIGMIVSSAMVWHSSVAAFSSSTTNPANAWAAGTVSLSDDDSGAAFPALTGVKPGDTGTRCIVVTYTGSIGAAVSLHGTASGALASELEWGVEEGRGGSFGSCTGFVPTSVPYAGTVSTFAASHSAFASGVGAFAPVRQNDTRTYKLTWTLPTSATGAGTTANLDLTWSAASLDHQPGYGFGWNTYGQLGVGDAGEHTTPTAMGSESSWSALSTGQYHACAIRADRTLWCWGFNGDTRLGLGVGDTTTRTSPTKVGTDTDWAELSGGDGHTCALKTTGTLWCWGYNGNGELGLAIGDTTTRAVPTQVGTATDWADVAAGWTHTCAAKTTGTLWCWGYNGYGQLGAAGPSSQVPVQVGVGTTWEQVSVGRYYSCATKSDGSLWCWGKNTSGALGVVDGADKSTPTQVGTGTDWALVRASEEHVCAVKVTGTLWCWGLGAGNRLGQPGDTTNKLTPVQVGAATTWTDVTVGIRHNCAISRTRTLYCWGTNTSAGVLGTGGASPSTSTPTQTRTGVQLVDASYDFTVSLSWPT